MEIYFLIHFEHAYLNYQLFVYNENDNGLKPSPFLYKRLSVIDFIGSSPKCNSALSLPTQDMTDNSMWMFLNTLSQELDSRHHYLYQPHFESFSPRLLIFP